MCQIHFKLLQLDIQDYSIIQIIQIIQNSVLRYCITFFSDVFFFLFYGSHAGQYETK